MDLVVLQKVADQYVGNGNLFDYGNLTDQGNAQRFALLALNDCRYCALWKKWLIWDGKRWHPDEMLKILTFAKAAIKQMMHAAASTSDDERRRERIRFCLRSESDARIKAMLDLARANP